MRRKFLFEKQVVHFFCLANRIGAIENHYLEKLIFPVILITAQKNPKKLSFINQFYHKTFSIFKIFLSLNSGIAGGDCFVQSQTPSKHKFNFWLAYVLKYIILTEQHCDSIIFPANSFSAKLLKDPLLFQTYSSS